MADQAPRYSVEVWDLDEFFSILGSLPESQQTRVTELMAGHLGRAPRRTLPPLLKELRGKWKGVYQFELGNDCRLLYEVEDSPRKTVRIFFLGKHPEWDKRRKMDQGR